MEDRPATAYKVLTRAQMDAFERDGVFKGAPVDVVDGYIHLSTAAQLAETVDKHFGGQDNLVIAEVDLIALGEAVRWEPSRGGQLFPHVHADLPISAVVAHQPLERSAAGTIRLPGAFKSAQ